MKELDNEKLNELLGILTDAVRSGAEQLPGVAAEWLTWQESSCYFFLALGILALIVGPLSVLIGFKTDPKGDYWGIPAVIGGMIVAVLGPVLITINLYYLIYLSTAPRAYLLEYLLK
jgi:hypothetical protein